MLIKRLAESAEALLASPLLSQFYIHEESYVLYRSKDGKKENMFNALEWWAAMCSHVPNKGEPMVRHYGYYGYYSNVSP